LLMEVGQISTNYVYDCMNRLTQAGSTIYDWDKDGNLIGLKDGQSTWNYTYDFENRLTVVKLNGAVQNRFYYDAEGRRVTLWNSQSGYVNHVYSDLDIIFENSSTGCTKHFYANGLHIAENRSGVIEYYHQDHLGSTRLKTNSTGGIVFSSNYIPFGPAYASEGNEEFKYTGKHEDSTGLYYFGARYYDPETGRFITADTVLGDLNDPQSLNRYVYCRNNPLKYTDPDGRFWNVAIGAAAGAIVGFFTHLATHPGDYGGAAVSMLVGAGAGAIAGATFGVAALYLASGTVSASSLIGATAAIGSSVGKVLLASSAASVVGGVAERCFQGMVYSSNVAYGTNLPGAYGKPAEPLDPKSLGLDLVGGIAGGLAGYGVGWVAARYSWRIASLTWMAQLDAVHASGRASLQYFGYGTTKSVVSGFTGKTAEDVVDSTLDSARFGGSTYSRIPC